MVLTRQASKLLSATSDMATGGATATDAGLLTTSVTVSTPISRMPATTTTYTTILTPIPATSSHAMVEPIITVVDHESSNISDGEGPDIESPLFNSFTAQNIRREIRGGLQPIPEVPRAVNNLQQMVEASVGLCQSRMMKEFDEKIEKALREVKQALAAMSGSPAPSIPAQNHYTQPPVGFRPSAVTGYAQHQPQLEQYQPGPPPLIPAPNATHNIRQTNQQNWHPQDQQFYGVSNPNDVPNDFRQEQVFPPQPRFNSVQGNLQQQQPSAPPIQPYNHFRQPIGNQRPRQPQDVGSAHNFPPTTYQHSYATGGSNRSAHESIDRFKLAKWGLKFDGTSKTLNVQEFIFRVSALRRDYDCSDEEVLRSFHLLLEGPALDWYWDYRKIVHVTTWQELEKALLSQYRQYEKEYQVQMKILNRRQSQNEPFDEFYNAIIKLRNQQVNPYEEEQLVEIMRANLKPSLAQMMFSVQLRTLAEFRREVRRAENLLSNHRQLYQARANFPQRVNELDYNDEEEPLIDLEVDAVRTVNSYVCWNCKVSGHTFFDCPEPITRQFCFRCGRDNVVAPKCPRCQGNRPRNPSRTGEARSTEV